MACLYSLKGLRGDILHTLEYITKGGITTKGLLNALRQTGYPDLTTGDLKKQIWYLHEKKLIKVVQTKNYITSEEFETVAITTEGTDILEKTKCDPGIEIP